MTAATRFRCLFLWALTELYDQLLRRVRPLKKKLNPLPGDISCGVLNHLRIRLIALKLIGFEVNWSRGVSGMDVKVELC